MLDNEKEFNHLISYEHKQYPLFKNKILDKSRIFNKVEYDIPKIPLYKEEIKKPPRSEMGESDYSRSPSVAQIY